MAERQEPELRRGARGEEVRLLQGELNRLGLEIEVDGELGAQTEQAVLRVQTMFGYRVDGVADPATRELIREQIGYGFDVRSPDAEEIAKRHQRRVYSQAKPGGASNVANVSREGEIPEPPTPSR